MCILVTVLASCAVKNNYTTGLMKRAYKWALRHRFCVLCTFSDPLCSILTERALHCLRQSGPQSAAVRCNLTWPGVIHRVIFALVDKVSTDHFISLFALSRAHPLARHSPADTQPAVQTAHKQKWVMRWERIVGGQTVQLEAERGTKSYEEPQARLRLRNPNLFIQYRAQGSTVALFLRTEWTGGVRLSVNTMSAATASITDVSRTDFTNTDLNSDRNRAGKTDYTEKQT